MKDSILTVLLLLFFAHFIKGQSLKGYKPIVFDPTYKHTKWTTEPSDKIYEFAAFTSSFDSNDDDNGDNKADVWGIPEWVAYEIKGIPNQTKSGKRPSKWLTDTEGLKEGIVPSNATYAVSGTRDVKEVKTEYRYVRGHLCPKQIASRVSLHAAYNTHTTLNAVPQLQWQNAGIWLDLEIQTIAWAEKHNRVWVVCGPVFFGKNPAVWLGQEGEVKAAVPDALYKIIIKEKNGKPDALAFLIPNIIPSDKDNYSEYLTSVDRIETLTGLDFMANIQNIRRMEKSNEKQTNEQKEIIVNNW